jgi:hypothetical protein
VGSSVFKLLMKYLPSGGGLMIWVILIRL